MENNITHQEKLDFYKKYYSKDIQTKIHKYDKIFKSLIVSTFVGLPTIAIIAGFFIPWCFLGLLPAVAIPLTILSIDAKKYEKILQSINPNITSNDMYEMLETGEWKRLGQEISFETMKNNHYVKEKSYIVEEPKKQENKGLISKAVENNMENDNLLGL